MNLTEAYQAQSFLITSRTSDKLQNYTDIYSFVKRRKWPNEDQNVLIWWHKICKMCQEKMLTSPIGDMTRFSDEKENQPISVFNKHFSRSLKKLNEKS